MGSETKPSTEPPSEGEHLADPWSTWALLPKNVQEEILRDIPNRYRTRRLEDFSEGARRVVEAFFEELYAGEGTSLYIRGVIGSGKSTLAAKVLMRWRWEHRYVIGEGTLHSIFLPAYEAARRLRDLNEVKRVMLDWSAAPFLVLDDIGAQRSTPHVQEQLLFLIQERYDWNRPTIVTSNDSLDKFAETVDPRAAGRMQDGLLLELTGGDRRRNQGRMP
jgi:DNA replication protein DnaC